MKAGGAYTHEATGNASLMVYAVSGAINVQLGGHEIDLPENQALAVHLGASTQTLRVASEDNAHLVILQGTPIREPFFQKGPFVMSSLDEIHQVTAAYEAGLLGAIAE